MPETNQRPARKPRPSAQAQHLIIRAVQALLISALLSGCAAVVVGGVAATGMAVHDRRSVGTVLDDNLLKVRVRDALYGQEAFDQNVRLRVTAHNGWVLLAGEAGSEDHVQLASRTVSEVDGVRRLFNELAPQRRVSIPQSNSDRWLSTRVNGSLTRIGGLPGFDATRVNVTTARGIVYLMGLVTREEAEAVAEQARTVRGVERVVLLFEFMDEPAP